VEKSKLFNTVSSKLPATHGDWHKLFSYAEVACFVSAWAVGLLIAMQSERPNRERVATRAFASSTDVFGIQATLAR
jgi:hypothetical protein